MIDSLYLPTYLPTYIIERSKKKINPHPLRDPQKGLKIYTREQESKRAHLAEQAQQGGRGGGQKKICLTQSK